MVCLAKEAVNKVGEKNPEALGKTQLEANKDSIYLPEISSSPLNGQASINHEVTYLK